MALNTPKDIIDVARFILNDFAPTGLRQSDAELLGYFNLAVAEASKEAETLMMIVAQHVCEANEAEQRIAFADAQRFVQVNRVVSGPVVIECDKRVLDTYNPNWLNDTAQQAVNWMRSTSEDPTRFFIYPKAPAGQVLEVAYVKNPTVYGLNDALTDLPLKFKTAAVDYIVFRAESKDDEHVLSNRAAGHYSKFLMGLGVKPEVPAKNYRGE